MFCRNGIIPCLHTRFADSLRAENFIYNVFYNFNYNVRVYTLVILPICEISVWHISLLCVQRKTPDDGQRNCLKHVEFYSKNKFEKLVHLVGFITRIYEDERSPERQIYLHKFFTETGASIKRGKATS